MSHSVIRGFGYTTRQCDDSFHTKEGDLFGDAIVTPSDTTGSWKLRVNFQYLCYTQSEILSMWLCFSIISDSYSILIFDVL